jgi:hypothetical protein
MVFIKIVLVTFSFSDGKVDIIIFFTLGDAVAGLFYYALAIN